MVKATPVRRTIPVVLVVMLAAAVAQAFGRFSYAVLLPAIQRDLGISYTLAGALGTSNLVAYLVGTALVSLAVSRLSVVRIVQVSLAGSAAGLGMLAFGGSLPWLWAGMVLTGLTGAGVWVPSPGLAAAVVPARRRGFAIGFIGAGIGLGLVFLSLVAGSIADEQWQQVYRIEAGIGGLAVVAALFVFRGLSVTGGDRPRLRDVRLIPGWRALLSIYTAYGLSMSLFVNFLTAMLRQDAGFEPAAAAAMFSVFGIATVAGGPVFGRLADRIGRARAMIGGFVGMAAAALAVLTGIGPVVVLSVIVFGLGFAGVPTSVAAFISDHVDAQSFGAAFGVATLAFGAAQIFGPQLGGVIGDLVGSFWPVFVASASLASIGGGLAVWLRRVPHSAV